jgi:hypothetical protein
VVRRRFGRAGSSGSGVQGEKTTLEVGQAGPKAKIGRKT